MDDAALENTIARASACPLLPKTVDAFADDIRAGRILLPAALEGALERRDGHAVTVLALAGVSAGHRLSIEQLLACGPWVENVQHWIVLLAATQGSPLAVTLQLLARGQHSSEREATAVLYAAENLAGRPCPPELLRHVRLLLQAGLSLMGKAVLAAAVLRMKLDESQLEGAAAFHSLASTGAARRIASGLREMFRSSVSAALRDTAEHVPIKRVNDKVGRNDPCPCGSGRKYKKCCARKKGGVPRPPAVARTPRPPRRAGRHLTTERLDKMRIVELRALDPEQLSPACLMTGMRRLATHNFWEECERWLTLAARRGPAASLREELLYHALDAGQDALVQKLYSAIDDPSAVAPELRLAVVLAQERGPALELLEQTARAALRGECQEVDLANTIVHRLPALGIYFARGCLSSERLLEADTVLDGIAQARIRLDLPSADPAYELVELLDDAEERDWEGRTSAARKAESLNAELRSLRKSLHDAEERGRALEKDLRAQQEELATSAQDPDPPPQVPPEELRRLRGKVAELKGLLKEKAAERRTLREELAQAKRAQKNTVPDDAEAAEDVEGEQADGPPRGLLLPAWTSNAEEELRRAPPRVAASTLRVAYQLGAGHDGAWREVKKLKRVVGILSARVGIHYRLLFRIDSDEGCLRMLSLVHRQSLLTAIKRLA